MEPYLRQIVRDLDLLGTPWALVGALALGVRTEPRETRDVDIAIAARDDPESWRCVNKLQEFGYELTETIEHDQTHRLATVKMQSDAARGHIPLDLFFASAGVEPEVVESAELLPVAPGLRIPVARTGHMIAVKLLWRRSDKLQRDMAVLLSHAQAPDLEEARELLGLISERGYNRGKDLSAALEAWRQEALG